MAKVIFAIVVLAILDRAIPVVSLRYVWSKINVDLKTLYARYGVVRFPRIIFAVTLCVFMGLDSLGENAQVLGAAASVVLYCAFAALDLWRALKVSS
jgi:hypothetical protein